jgi:hypothetical protein
VIGCKVAAYRKYTEHSNAKLDAKLSTKGEHIMNKTLGVPLAAIGIAVFMFTSRCGPIGQKSPSQVVVAAYMAANEGKYSEAEKYLSSHLINAIKGGLGALAGGMKGFWDYKTRKGTIQTIEILKEEVRGEGATVYFRIHFKDGNTEDAHESLIKEGGQGKSQVT